MVLNPRKAFEEGLVKGIEGFPAFDPEKQIQQAGIDIRVAKIFTVHTNIVSISETEKPKFDQIYRELYPDARGMIRLEPGKAYSVDSMEYVKIPHDMSALVVHRSTFNRIGVLITGANYDPGFEGNIGVTMYVHNLIEIAIGTRIAQILFIKTDAANNYHGTYQKQKSHVSK